MSDPVVLPRTKLPLSACCVPETLQMVSRFSPGRHRILLPPKFPEAQEAEVLTLMHKQSDTEGRCKQ